MHRRRNPARAPRPQTKTQKQIQTNDGFDNISARLGLGQDNLLARSGYVPGGRLSQQTLDDMYRTSWVVARMVEVVAEDMLRGGVDIRARMPPEDVDALLAAFRSAGVPGRLTDAVKWGRLYGGAIAVLLIDGHDPASPLETDAVPKGAFKGLHVLDRHSVNPSAETISELGPMLGYPEYYEVQSADGMKKQRIHHSRALRFIGADLPLSRRREEQHWGASVVERAYDRILALDSATHGAANLVFKSFLRVIGIENYRSILASGGRAEAALHKMLAVIRQMQSNEGLTILDKNDHFYSSGCSFTGIYESVQAFCEQIAGASGIPLVRLLGQSPKGFSSGEADLRVYYDTIATACEDDLRGPYATLFAVLARHLWGRDLPPDFTFAFRSLHMPTEMEKSRIAASEAKSLAELHKAGLLDARAALSALRDSGRITGRFAGLCVEPPSSPQET